MSASPQSATLLGAGAIALWGALALFAAMTGAIPPFQVTAITFAIAGFFGLAITAARGRLRALKPTPASFALGLFGFFVYHACYFAAVKLAPPAEAQLIASLWALLIVLFSALLPGHRLQPRHALGAIIGLAAATILIWPKLGANAGASVWLGYGLAAACALTWSAYSVLSRLVTGAATESLSLTCLATAALAIPFHLLLETSVWPSGAAPWLALLALGLGPVGGAFFLWDIGMKRGDVSLLGALSYATPVISTGLLVLAGYAAPDWRLALAIALMVFGALVATYGRAAD